MPEELQLMPLIWDLLTFVRLGGMGVVFLGWFLFGLAISPFVFRKFDEATRGYVDWMVDEFERMFIEADRRLCLAAIVLSMSAFGAVGIWITSALPWGFGYHIIRGIIIGLLVYGGFKLPRITVKWLWNRRVAKFEDQLLDALAFMSNGLKSGLSLVQCMEMVVEELGDPISQEFGLVMSEHRIGVQLEDCLLNLEERIDTEDLQILVTSINILRQSGGNLSETFQTISHTIRERKKVEGRIRSLTAQGISQAVIIVIMPFALGLILWTFDHELIARLWSTWIGWLMIFVMLILQAVGALIMKRIVTIRV